jgi:hypothetical protein
MQAVEMRNVTDVSLVPEVSAVSVVSDVSLVSDTIVGITSVVGHTVLLIPGRRYLRLQAKDEYDIRVGRP